MKVLVGCEYSGIVSEAFRRKGHDVTSCDLKDSVSPSKHYKGNVFDIIDSGFDLGIFHPPCTFLCKGQFHLLNKSQERTEKMFEAIDFIKKIYNSNIEKIAIENPIGIIPKYWRSYDQLIYAYQFGDPHSKDICFWLKNLPPLICTCFNPKKQPVKNHTNGRMSQEQKSHIKSKFFPLVAAEMANQWG